MGYKMPSGGIAGLICLGYVGDGGRIVRRGRKRFFRGIGFGRKSA